MDGKPKLVDVEGRETDIVLPGAGGRVGNEMEGKPVRVEVQSGHPQTTPPGPKMIVVGLPSMEVVRVVVPDTPLNCVRVVAMKVTWMVLCPSDAVKVSTEVESGEGSVEVDVGSPLVPVDPGAGAVLPDTVGGS